jgi:hypothetical protein
MCFLTVLHMFLLGLLSVCTCCFACVLSMWLVQCTSGQHVVRWCWSARLCRYAKPPPLGFGYLTCMCTCMQQGSCVIFNVCVSFCVGSLAEYLLCYRSAWAAQATGMFCRMSLMAVASHQFVMHVHVFVSCPWFVVAGVAKLLVASARLPEQPCGSCVLCLCAAMCALIGCSQPGKQSCSDHVSFAAARHIYLFMFTDRP